MKITITIEGDFSIRQAVNLKGEFEIDDQSGTKESKMINLTKDQYAVFEASLECVKGRIREFVE